VRKASRFACDVRIELLPGYGKQLVTERRIALGDITLGDRVSEIVLPLRRQ
jgi:hypothetical protein